MACTSYKSSGGQLFVDKTLWEEISEFFDFVKKLNYTRIFSGPEHNRIQIYFNLIYFAPF